MAIAVTIAPNQVGPEELSRFITERILITGTTGIVGDTAVYTPKYVKKPIGVLGAPAARAIAANGQITFTATQALGNGVVDALVYGNAA